MTIICYRDGIMAADTGSTSGGVRSALCKKIGQAKDGTIGAGTGAGIACLAFTKWIEGGAKGTFAVDVPDEDFYGMLVRPPKKRGGEPTVCMIDHKGREYTADWIGGVAIGCGEYIARGAMLAGATAEEAALICVENHTGCFGDIQVVKVPRYGMRR